MKNIFKILRKYTIEIIFIILCVIIQAYCDLELPSYTSKIINIGIGQSGIEYAVPYKIRESEFDFLLNTLSDDKKEYVLKQYELYNNIYVLKNKEKNTLEELDNIILSQIVVKYLNLDVNIIEFSDSDSLLRQSAIEYIKNEYKEVNLDIKDLQISYIKEIGIKMIYISLIAFFITVSTNFLISKVSSYFGHDLRKKIIEKIMSYSSKEYNEIGVSSLITRCTNDVQQIQMFLTMFLRIVIFAPIIGIGALTKVSKSSMSYIIAIALFLILTLVVVLLVVVLPKFNLVQKKVDKINLISREMLKGMPVVRAFSNEKFEENRFNLANNELKKVNLFVNRTMSIMMPTMTFIMNAVSILIVWVGASKVDAGNIQVGTLIAFITYTMQIIMSFLMLSMVSIVLPRALISFKRIKEVLLKDSCVIDENNNIKLKENEDILEFKEVYFRYPDASEDILSNISFKCKKGTTTAFIGSTGSGKSTLINLIPRFFDITSGKILLNGVSIKDIPLKKLRDKIGYVPQKAHLFSGTIEENIKFGNEKLSKKEIDEVLKVSMSYDFVKKLPNKLKTHVSEGGTNLSGGQRQRLSIARAIAKKPLIYIFDDSFSALDYETDKNLRKNLKKYTKDSTLLIVAQRVNTILNADQIIVFDEGKIVGIGTHEELYKTSLIYKEIVLSQLGEEELKNA